MPRCTIRGARRRVHTVPDPVLGRDVLAGQIAPDVVEHRDRLALLQGLGDVHQHRQHAAAIAVDPVAAPTLDDVARVRITDVVEQAQALERFLEPEARRPHVGLLMALRIADLDGE